MKQSYSDDFLLDESTDQFDPLSTFLKFLSAFRGSKTTRPYEKKSTDELISLFETVSSETTRYATLAKTASDKAEKTWAFFQKHNPDPKKISIETLEDINSTIQDHQRDAQGHLHYSRELAKQAADIKHELSLRKTIQELDAKMIGYADALRKIGEESLASKEALLFVEKKRIASELNVLRAHVNTVLSARSELAQNLTMESIILKRALLAAEISSYENHARQALEQSFTSELTKAHGLFASSQSFLRQRAIDQADILAGKSIYNDEMVQRVEDETLAEYRCSPFTTLA